MKLDPIKIHENLTDEECDKLIEDFIILDENEFKVDHIHDDGMENHFTYKKYEKDVNWENADSVYDLITDIFNNEHFAKREKLLIIGNILTYNKNQFVKVIKKQAKQVRKGYACLQGTITMQRQQMNVMKEKNKNLQEQVMEKNREIKKLKKENNWIKCNKNKIANGAKIDSKFVPESLREDYENGNLAKMFENSKPRPNSKYTSFNNGTYVNPNFNKPKVDYDKVQPTTNSTPNLEPQPKKKIIIVRKKNPQS